MPGARQWRKHRGVRGKNEPARGRIERNPFSFRESEWIAGCAAIFDGARFGYDRASGIFESDDSLNRLPAAADVSLREWADPRVGKHEQAFETIALLQWHEDRLHRGRWKMFDRERNCRRQRHYRCRVGR